MSKHRVLVTGATGYVGSQLVKRLTADGRDVHVVVRKDSERNLLDEVAGHLQFYEHDSSTEGMLEIIQAARPETVFHLASYVIGEHRPDQVRALVDSNVLFGTQLLEAMAIYGVPNLVNTGTSWQHYNSPDYRPACLYAATKQAFEDIIEYYVDATPMRAITLSLFDNYGPDDPRNKIINLLRRTAEQGAVLKMSPGRQLIDIVYIDDVVNAYCIASDMLERECVRQHEVFAVSSGIAITLRELVAEFEKVIGKPVAIEWGGRPYREREVMEPWDKGRQLPGWYPLVSLREGLERTVALP